MADFIPFKTAAQKQLAVMSPTGLFVTDVDKEYMYNLYQDSYKPEDNPLFRERREYDCNCCKQFIRLMGGVVSIIDGNVVSIWDDQSIAEHPVFGRVATALATYVKSRPIKDLFYHYEKHAGTNKTRDVKDFAIQWDHFYAVLPNEVVKQKSQIPTLLGDIRETKNVFKRSMEELKLESAVTVLELIEPGEGLTALYRGIEFKPSVVLFQKLKKAYDKLPNALEKELYAWTMAREHGHALRFRNTAIGTLLTDLSDGVDEEKAVKAFESKVAPLNYKRPTAAVTPAMLKKAQETVIELGYEPSLYRRHARATDITINNVLFADRAVRKILGGGVFDDLLASAKQKPANGDKAEEISIENFLKNILPKAQSLDVLFENRHAANLMSLIAPLHPDSKCITKHGNNFTHDFRGGAASSIKERVKSKGGKIDADVRVSLAWYNYDDLDLHAYEPNGHEIYFGNRNRHSPGGGQLDVDMNAGGGSSRSAVENITWNNRKLMKVGKHRIVVHNFRERERIDVGFEVEFEFDGQVYNFHYGKLVGNNARITIAEFEVHKDGTITFTEESLKKLSNKAITKKYWGIDTNTFHRVNMAMFSPNHWDDLAVGQKHLFFIVENCLNDEAARGFYNEQLTGDLEKHRKVFELLGNKMKVPDSTEQLSGLGFSFTEPSNIVVRVGTGSGPRQYKIIF